MCLTRFLRRVLLVGIAISSAMGVVIVAQGPQALTAAQLDAVKKDVSLCGPFVPFVDRLIEAADRQQRAEVDAQLKNLGLRVPIHRAGIDDELIKLEGMYDRLPFFIDITTPCGRAASLIERAKKRYEDPVLPSLEELNSDGIRVRVRPARIGQTDEQRAIENLVSLARKGSRVQSSGVDFDLARPIENVIIRRGGEVIRPTRKDEKPLTIQTSAGASKQVNEGEFFFPFSAFDPTADIVLVLISGDQNDEMPVTKAELASRVK